jgi:hypothetical protein
MNSQDNLLEALIRELGMTHCPACQIPISPATVQVGWDYDPTAYPFGPLTWLKARHNILALRHFW